MIQFICIFILFFSNTLYAEISEILYPTFRGSFQRNGMSTGSVPTDPSILWKYPEKKGMCGKSKVGGKPKIWCGTGWTGQPLAYKSKDGTTVVTFGAYDYGVHFLNADNGKNHLPTFYTKDIIKGTGTLNIDGLMAIGSRDNYMRILRLSGGEITELWSLNGNIKGGIWNNDWDASPLFYEDYFIAGGENGWLFIYKLNKVIINSEIQIQPEEIVRIPGFDNHLIQQVGDRNMSIENSIVLDNNKIYFANSGGMIWGYDFNMLIENPVDYKQALVFKFWAGDDIDATMVIDNDGMLYVGVELERVGRKYITARRRSTQTGQILKLNPNKWNINDSLDSLEVLEWSIPLKINPKFDNKAGVWASPALYADRLYVSTNNGKLLVINKYSGEIVWSDYLGQHAWSSPVISDNGENLLVTGCDGLIRNYSIKANLPSLIWEFKVPGGPCIESTPLVLDHTIYVGTRDGYFYAIGDE